MLVRQKSPKMIQKTFLFSFCQKSPKMIQKTFLGHWGFRVFVNKFVSLFTWYNFCSTAIDGKCLQIISIIHSPKGD